MSSPQRSSAVSESLAGLRVVELATVLAGPLCSQTLADHGATVIKIEPPAGDQTRHSTHLVGGQPAYFSGVNRNKSCIALDLTKESARAVLLRLLENADVLLENFLPGTMDRWGLGRAVLAEKFPRLIHCAISGFGADGPLGGKPGYDAVGQAYCGLMSVNGSKADGATRHGIPIVDIASGMNAVIGILLALAERARSGKGQYIDITLFDSGMALHHPYAAMWFGSHIAPEPVGNGHPDVAPYNKFRAKDGDIFIGAPKDAQFRRLVELLGQPQLADDPRFVKTNVRVVNKEALEQLLAPHIARFGVEELADALMKVQVAAAPIYGLPEAFRSSHTKHRQMHVELDGYQGIGIPVKLSRTPGSVKSVPHGFAEDTDSVLSSLGYSPSEVATLIAEGALGAPGKIRK